MTAVVICENPFQVLIEPHQVRPAREDETLAEMAPTTPGAWACSVNDRWIPKELWHHMPPPGSVVEFRAIPQGGGGGGSRAVLQIVSIIAISYFTAGLGTAFGAQLTRVGLTLAANAIINNLVPLDVPSSRGTKRTYSVDVQGNASRLGEPIPEVFGFDNSFPDLAAQPYTYFERIPGIVHSQQVLHVMLVVGVGQYHICRVSNGDTNLLNFSDVDIVRIGPGQSTMDGPGDGVESIEDQDVVDPRWITSLDVQSIELRAEPVGPFTACPPGRTVDRLGIDIVLPRGLVLENEMIWRVETRLIDDFDEPLGTWTTIGTHTWTQHTDYMRRLTYEYDVPEGRYEVRVTRTDVTAQTDLTDADQIDWFSLKARVVDGDISVEGCTFIGIRIRATGQISGGLRFRVMSYRMLPVWDGDAWGDPEVTRNPAWAFAQVLRSRGIPDERIDLDQLLALSVVWANRYDSFDYKFGEQVSTWDAVSMIARVGRAVPLIRGSRYTVVRDGPETLPVAHYGMRNIVRGSMQMKPTLSTSEQMRTLDMEYFDHRRQNWMTVTAQIHNGTIYGYRTENQVAERSALGIPAPDENRRGRIKMPGIIGFNHAMRTVTYTLADRYYRSIDVELDTELDGQLPCPLNLVLFSHDIGDFGQGGDIVSWDDGTLTIETTEPLAWGDGSHAIRLATNIGTLTSSIAVTPGIDDYHAVLASDPTGPDFEFITDDATRERTRYVFSPQESAGALAKVRGIVPSDERRIGMRLVLEDDRVHSVDAPWITPDQLPACEIVVSDEPAILFLDEFTGSGGIQFHTPDIAPSGFEYQQTGLAGSLTCTGGVAGSNNNFDAAGENNSLLNVSITPPFYMEITAGRGIYTLGLTEAAHLLISGTAQYEVAIISNDIYEYAARVISPTGELIYPIGIDGMHTCHALFTPTETIVTVNGVAQTPVAESHTPFIMTDLQVYAAAEDGAVYTIDRVVLATV